MRTVLRWGLVIGIVNAVWLYGSYWMGLHTSGLMLFQLVPLGWLLITAAGYALAMRAVQRRPAPTFLRGWMLGAGIAVVAAGLAVVMQIGYFNVVHPEWPEYMVGQTRAYYEARGADVAEVEERAREAQASFGLARYAAGSAVTALIAGIVLSPIFWAVARRRRRVAAVRDPRPTASARR